MGILALEVNIRNKAYMSTFFYETIDIHHHFVFHCKYQQMLTTLKHFVRLSMIKSLLDHCSAPIDHMFLIDHHSCPNRSIIDIPA